MRPKLLSLIDDPPTGFETGTIRKRDLLSGAVVLLVSHCDVAYELLPDFRERVEGVLLTFGAPAIEPLGPLLWHLSLPREALDQAPGMLEALLAVTAKAADFRNEAIVAKLAQERLSAEYAARSDDYRRVTDALKSQVALLAASENKLQTILDSVDACIYLKDTQYRYLFVNRALLNLLGKTREEIIGLSDADLFDNETATDFRRNDEQVLREGHTVVAEETAAIRLTGLRATYRSTKLPLFDQDGRIYALCGISTDITQIKEREAQLKRIAHYDMLTLLPNRVLLADRVHQAMTAARRRQQLLAVAYLDLDGFKAINDRHGHGVGDKLLVALSAGMKQTLRESDTLARLGGDEFIAVLLDLPNAAASVPMITRLLAAAAQPVQVDGLTLGVSASIGVTFYPQLEEVDADQLFRQADQAMYQAKLTGKNRYHFFDTEEHRSVRGMHESHEYIRRALEAQQFVLHYQPKVNMRTGEVTGVEALVRWQHPTRGLLAPALFLPIIEDHPLAVQLGDWVVDQALTQLEIWEATRPGLSVSVNVGARQLLHPGFVRRLGELLAKHPDAPPDRLEIEILETSALKDLAQVSEIIEECRAIGVRFSLDDFGTGYSSLSYLKRLPVDQLKVDGSFVRDMLDDPDDVTILDGILSLATAFGREVIAEGVETDEHGTMLLRLGCVMGQGYGIAPPMPPRELGLWLDVWQPHRDWVEVRPARRAVLPLLYAWAEHHSWAGEVERYLEGKGARISPEVPCRFAAWLHSGDAAAAVLRDDGERVKRCHQRTHQLAREMVEKKQAGKHVPDRRQFRDAVEDLLAALNDAMDQ